MIELALHDCTPMHARITLRQCAVNRENEHILCLGCEGLKGEKGEVIVGVVGICEKCKKNKEIIAKGLCRICYDALRQAKKNAARRRVRETPFVEEMSELPESTGNTFADLAESYDGLDYHPVDRPAHTRSTRSLLSMITPPPEVKTEGIFLDFSARPGLLVDLEAISDDVPGDILELCSMLVSGKLRGVA
ncbi:MAG: hypothetical protein EHM79_02080 [Geobacter sp.]|nr:MAG: hypothetical protein EHM79_02080 [Geobacter sp.]